MVLNRSSRQELSRKCREKTDAIGQNEDEEGKKVIIHSWHGAIDTDTDEPDDGHCKCQLSNHGKGIILENEIGRAHV